MLNQPAGALNAPGPAELFAQADRARRETIGDRVYLRGLIEFSNYCHRSCLYCGLRRENKVLSRYRLSDQQILAAANAAAKAGVDTVVLQSGEDPANTKKRIARLVALIKDTTGLAITLSLGSRDTASYRLWKEAGADRYLIKHETADPELYAKLHPGDSLQRRIDSLRRLGDLGYAVGTGFIIGVPGQNEAALEKDIQLVREIRAQMCGIGPFIPQQNTPFAHFPPGSVVKTLEAIARTRIACPHLNMPATTALASLAPEKGQLLALRAGANVIMPNFTPSEQRSKYRIYDGKKAVNMDIALRAIAEAGRIYQPSQVTPC